jgi:hypothetical protein
MKKVERYKDGERLFRKGRKRGMQMGGGRGKGRGSGKCWRDVEDRIPQDRCTSVAVK